MDTGELEETLDGGGGNETGTAGSGDELDGVKKGWLVGMVRGGERRGESGARRKRKTRRKRGIECECRYSTRRVEYKTVTGL